MTNGDFSELDPTWPQRVDKLLSKTAPQLGDVLESLQREVASIAERVAALSPAEATDPSAGATIAEAAERIAAVEKRVISLDETARGSVERIAGADEAIRASLERLSSLGEELRALTSEPLPPAELADRLHSLQDAFDKRLELLGRQIGAPLGRLRVQLEEIAGEVRALSSRPAAEEGSFDAVALEVAASVMRALDARLAPATERTERIVTSVEALAKAVGSFEEEALARFAAIEEAMPGVAEERFAGLATAVDDLHASVRQIVAKPQEIRDEVLEAVSAGVAPVTAARDGMKSVVELLGAVGDRLAAMERASNAVARTVGGQADIVSAHVTTALRGQVSEMVERITALDSRLVGLASAEQVEQTLANDREFMRTELGTTREQLQTLSGSAGAMYIRLRSLEDAIGDLRRGAQEDRDRLTVILDSLKEAVTVERDLAGRLGAMLARLEAAEQSTSE